MKRITMFPSVQKIHYVNIYTFILYLILSVTCWAMEVEREDVSNTNNSLGRFQVYVKNSATGKEQVRLKGNNVHCLFWGCYPHIDSIIFVEPKGEEKDIPIDSSLIPALLDWSRETCLRGNHFKISMDIPDDSAQKSETESFLLENGYAGKNYIYQCSLSNALGKAKKNGLTGESNNPNIIILTLEDIQKRSELYKQSESLFIQFNKTMLVPGFYEKSATGVLESGGSIFVYLNTQKNVAEGILAFGLYINHNNEKGMVVDTLFVSQNARGQKLSTKLIQHLLCHAKQEKFINLYWETGFGRKEAQSLYENKFEIKPYGVAWRYTPPTGEMIASNLGSILRATVSEPEKTLNTITELLSKIYPK